MNSVKGNLNVAEAPSRQRRVFNLEGRDRVALGLDVGLGVLRAGGTLEAIGVWLCLKTPRTARFALNACGRSIAIAASIERTAGLIVNESAYELSWSPGFDCRRMRIDAEEAHEVLVVADLLPGAAPLVGVLETAAEMNLNISAMHWNAADGSLALRATAPRLGTFALHRHRLDEILRRIRGNGGVVRAAFDAAYPDPNAG